MGLVVIFPVEKLFNCHYLGKVEAEINNLTYDEACPNFFFDHYNLNPIEDIENQIKSMNSNHPFYINVKNTGKLNDILESERNSAISGNIFLKALYFKYFFYFKILEKDKSIILKQL